MTYALRLTHDVCCGVSIYSRQDIVEQEERSARVHGSGERHSRFLATVHEGVSTGANELQSERFRTQTG